MLARLHGGVTGLARAMALLGGAVLLAMVGVVCLSVAGRATATLLHSDTMQGLAPGLAQALLALGIGPIRGDYELIEGGMALCVFAFLGWCQITGGHAVVDLAADRLPDRVRRVLMLLVECALAAVLVLIALKLHEGMQIQMRRRTTTFLLEYPVWWTMAAALVPACVAAAVGVWMAVIRMAELVQNRDIAATEQSA